MPVLKTDRFLPSLIILTAIFLTALPSLAKEASGGKKQESQAGLLQGKTLPPVIGKTEPRSMPVKGEDGIYHHSWFKDSFLDLKEDIAEARKEGKRVVLFVEMNGCPYCKKLQENVMSAHYIKQYVSQNYHAISINIYGSTSATDLDGKEMSENKLMRRWGVRVTPTLIFLPESVPDNNSKSGRQLLPIPPVLPSSFTPEALYDLFVWVKHKGYQGKTAFKDFYAERQAQRDLK